MKKDRHIAVILIALTALIQIAHGLVTQISIVISTQTKERPVFIDTISLKKGMKMSAGEVGGELKAGIMQSAAAGTIKGTEKLF